MKIKILTILFCCLSFVSIGQNFENHFNLFEDLFSQKIFERLSSYQKINGNESFVIFKDDEIITYYHEDLSDDNLHYFGEALLYRNDVQYFFVMDSIVEMGEMLTFEFHSTSRMKLEKDDKTFIRIKAIYRKINEKWELHSFQVKDETCCKW